MPEQKCSRCDGKGKIAYGRRVSGFGGSGFCVDGYNPCRECGETGLAAVQAALKVIDYENERKRKAIIAKVLKEAAERDEVERELTESKRRTDREAQEYVDRLTGEVGP